MDERLQIYLASGCLVDISNKNPSLSTTDLQRATDALHSDVPWICHAGCYALIRHQQDHLVESVVQVIEELYARSKNDIPIMGNLLRAFMWLSPKAILRHDGFVRIVYESAASKYPELRANAAHVLQSLAAEGDVHSKELLHLLQDDTDEMVRTNTRVLSGTGDKKL